MARRPFYSWAGGVCFYLAEPVSAMVVGLATPFQENWKDAALLPALVGTNANVMVQLPRVAMTALQVVLWTKNSLALAPVICGFAPGPIWIAGLMMSGFVLPFLMVTTAVDVVPITRRTPPTRIAVADRVIVVGATGTTPVPLSATECGLPAAFDAIDSVPALAPAAPGVNRIETVQEAAAGNVAPEQLSTDFEKSPAFAPPIEAPPASITRFALPVFDTVTV